MENDFFERYQRTKRSAYEKYYAQRDIYSPFFKEKIYLTSEGFYHLRYSAGRERNKKEQVLKLTLLPLGLYILRIATTAQEYRKKDGVEWWGFVAVFIQQSLRVRVIVRRAGKGNVHFWSIMPHRKISRKDSLYENDIEAK